ncbi:MAG: protein kinase [Calothrix sp. FI2-JRJ7]|jgi:serine/threonine protein kinase|nr:protein kinase [Calothrix sp. FI2-JRJ7]
MKSILLNNRYQIIRALGKGGFGETFLAEDTYLPSRRICVVKRLQPVTNNPKAYDVIQQRFNREAAILEQLGEANEQIPKLYAYFAEEEYFYLVQEWVEGLTLSQKLQHQQQGVLSENFVTQLLVSLLPVLDYIHKHGIIHRDIKPSNIIWRQKDSKPVLIDFGIAKEVMNTALNDEGEPRSIVVGTQGFMPPEQAAGQPVYSSDIYSLGMTAIFLLTGKHAYDIQECRQDIDISNHLAAVLTKATNSHPGERYNNAKAMLADLQPQDFLAPSPNKIIDIADIETTPLSGYSSKSPVEVISYTREEYRHRQILLNKVKNYWIKGVLETSLHGVVLIELGLENRFDALHRPWGMLWETPELARQPLPSNTKVLNLFQQMGAGCSLLILGEPGAGKTITLLELARDLIAQADYNILQPIPVVFNLSAWANERIPIAEWLVQELNTKYQVSKEIGRAWVKNQQLLLLLDGLDEVGAELRDACVTAINKFSQEYGETQIVVCSRIKDYEALPHRLRFQGAVFIQPLTLEQIHQYLHNAGLPLQALYKTLRADTTMQELAKSPLMLSIMTLAYQDLSVTDLPHMNLEERRQHLFDKYIQRMFSRRSISHQYSQKQATHWLIWLAKKLKKQSQTVFFIERMQPNWLGKWQPLYISGLVLIFLLITTPVGMLILPIQRVILVLIFTKLFFWKIFGFGKIHPAENLNWSWKNVRKHLAVGLILGPIFGVMLKLTAELIGTPSNLHGLITQISFDKWLQGAVFGLSLGTIFVLTRGLTSPSIQTLTYPNQGIWQSAKNAIIFGLIGLGLLGFTSIALLQVRTVIWGAFGLLFGVAAGGGEACIKHFILRCILYFNGHIPWNYARFLDYATERIFLRKVGGGYIFVHRSLLEHFAMDDERI